MYFRLTGCKPFHLKNRCVNQIRFYVLRINPCLQKTGVHTNRLHSGRRGAEKNKQDKYMSIKHLIVTLVFSTIILLWAPAFSQDIVKRETNSKVQSHELVETILDGIEKRYSTPAFSANFIQQSTIKAMNISDTATGTIKVKRPGMMRWEYYSPDPQIIITDGDKLWIYRPEDNQVMVGHAPALFKDGKGAGFLSDMKLLRDKFSVFLETTDISEKDDYYLRLYPEEQTMDLAAIFLVVDPENYVIKSIVTYNIYEDETRIWMTDYNFDVEFEDDTFEFAIPKGADILEME